MTVLVMIQGDPRVSPRPAEGVRVAAGLGSCLPGSVTVYLHDTAILALAEDTADWIQAEVYERYVPLLAQCNREIWVEKGSAWLTQLGRATAVYREIGERELAASLGRAERVLRL